MWPFKEKKSNHVILKIVGGAVLATIAAEVIMNFSDIKRYIKISTM